MTSPAIAPALPTTEPKRCQHQCPGGAQCGCRGDIRHTLHVCCNEHCPCHSQEAYELVNLPAQPKNESRT